MTNFVRSRKVWIGGIWLISLAIVVIALLCGDFGAPPMVFILCGLWLLSLGLPTTVSLLVLSVIWGRVPGMQTPGFPVFSVCAAILSLAAQTICFRAVIWTSNHWRRS
jgi:hypothetical protein